MLKRQVVETHYVSPEEELQKQPSHENKLHMCAVDTPDTLRDVCQHMPLFCC